MCKTNQCYHNKPSRHCAPADVSFTSSTAWRVYTEEAHEYSADKLSARRSRVQRLTYTLVDHKWVCFADCCRIVGPLAPDPGGPLNMHRSEARLCVPRDMALRLIASIICTVPISQRSARSWPLDRALIQHLETLRNCEVCRPSFIRRRFARLIRTTP